MKRFLRRGDTLIEMLIVAIIVLLLALLLGTAFSGMQDVWRMITGYNPALAEHRKVVDNLSEHIRNAQGCRNATYGIKGSVIAAASGTEIVYYTDKDSCDEVRYFLSGSNLMREADGKETVVAGNITDLNFSYLTSNTYHTTWTSTMVANTPTMSELPKLAGVKMRIATTVNDELVTSNVTIRFRNSPQKTRLDGL